MICDGRPNLKKKYFFGFVRFYAGFLYTFNVSLTKHFKLFTLAKKRTSGIYFTPPQSAQ